VIAALMRGAPVPLVLWNWHGERLLGASIMPSDERNL
jgi:hypothetical protein